ncbi:MAG: hypothetical protein ACNA8L_03540 [Luteolibacter sp.]
MTLDTFASLISSAPAPVILIEGRRSIPDDVAHLARRVSSMLATRFPALRFRSGNATGTDQAFAAGVIDVAPERLEIIAPYAMHRAKSRHPLVRYESPESLSEEELEQVKSLTMAATPANKSLIRCYGRGGRAAAQAACLIRDTLKVTGMNESARRVVTADRAESALPIPTAALFWVDPAEPETGGTGHTIRVCRLQGVPVIFQRDWQAWAV